MLKTRFIAVALTCAVMVGYAQPPKNAATVTETEPLPEAAAAALSRAQQSDADAQTNLGLMYTHGEGVEQNYSEELYVFSSLQRNRDMQLLNTA